MDAPIQAQPQRGWHNPTTYPTFLSVLQRRLLADLTCLVVHDNFDCARQSFAAKIRANFGLEIDRLAMGPQETNKGLQCQERLLRCAHKTEMQPKTVKVGSSALVHRRQVVHGNGRLPADPLRVVTDELDRLLPAEDVNRLSADRVSVRNSLAGLCAQVNSSPNR